MLPLLVTAAIIRNHEKILITRRKEHVPYPLLWEFPGGKMEKNEDPRECVVREIKEELDMDIQVEDIFDVVYYRYPERPVMVLAYRCRWSGGEIQDLEVTEHRWATASELALFDFLPADIPLIEQLQSKVTG